MSHAPKLQPEADGLPNIRDVRAAALRLEGIAHRTPVVTSTTADARIGAHIVFKCENLQRMGAFKFRGAYNCISQLSESQRRAGVITFSSGNHAQATALAAKLLGAPALILMPHDSAVSKMEATKGYGAGVQIYDRFSTDRDRLAAEIATERGLTIIPPYDDPFIVAGQGTATLELMEEAPALDMVVATLGGGGLLSGAAITAHGIDQNCKVVGVEPVSGDDGWQSLKAGRVVRIPPPKGLPEGALATHVGALNFEIIRRHVDEIVLVTDNEIVEAMKFFAQRMKLVVEPTGALPMAALLAGKLNVEGKTVGAIISGGNVDLDRFGRLIA